jgi:hypothetical protein
MSMNLILKLKLTCPRHPRYNPELHGQGAIKGGCDDCERIYELFISAIHIRQRVREKFDELASTSAHLTTIGRLSGERRREA